MKKTKAFPTPQGIYKLVKHEWNIHSNRAPLRKVRLQELGISPLDVNWLLYTVERKYEIEIKEEPVSLQVTLEDFIRLILKASKD